MQKGRSLYDFPRYYDIAFSFRDIFREAQVFDECITLYSKVRVRRVLELGSGTSPHLEEWRKRGIEYVGIDKNRIMLSYSRNKARVLRMAPSFVKADMRNFSLERHADFAYTMLGSLFVETTSDLRSHFRSVARALNSGGLYFLDWCVNFHWGQSSRSSRWTITKDKVRVNVKFATEVLNVASQMVKNTLIADVNDNGKRFRLESADVVRTIFPQEFIVLAEESDKFEFLGWWNHWNLQEPVDKATRISRPIALLLRK